MFLFDDIEELYARVDMLELTTNDTKAVDDMWSSFGVVDEPYESLP